MSTLMKTLLTLFALCALTVVTAPGQETATPAAKNPMAEDLQRLFRLMPMREMIEGSKAQTTAAMQAQADESLRDMALHRGVKQLPEEEEQKFRSLVDEYVNRIWDEADLIPFTERMSIEIYPEHFTHEEIKGILQFYETPLGQKTLKVMPALMAEIQAATSLHLSGVIDRVTEEMVEQHPELEQILSGGH